jgi:NitT/TauT family transport system substrate-binding protein
MMDKKPNQLTRRNVIGGIAAGATLALTEIRPSLAQSIKHIFIEPFDLILEFMPELNAAAGGHFKAQGLDIEIINARGTSVAMQQVVAKQASFSKVGALDLMKAHALQKVPLVSVATVQQGALFSVVSLKSAPIMSPADMRGKTIGVASLGGGTENNLDLMLAGAGVPGKEVVRQPVGLSPGNVELMKQGRIAAFFATVEVAVALKRTNAPVEIWGADKFAPMPGGAYVVTREFAEQNPQAVTQFVRALKASTEELLSSDLNKILDRAEKQFEITGDKDRAYRLDALKAYNELVLAQGREDVLKNVPEIWRKGAELTTKAGVANVTDVDSLYTNRFLEEASKT